MPRTAQRGPRDIYRVVPLTGTEAWRRPIAAAGGFLPDEVVTTRDEGRQWIMNTFVGPTVYHGIVANEVAMLALNYISATGRGCYRGDTVYRSDTLSMWELIVMNSDL